MNSPETTPFSIRAHHLLNEAWMFSRASTLLYSPDPHLGDGSPIDRHISGNTDYILNHPDVLYKRDVLGDNPKERALERSRLEFEYILAFAQLEGSYPVHLVNERDGICATCVIGQHCDEPDRIDEESVNMKEFIKKAESRGKIEGHDFIAIKDNEDRVLRVETTKKVILGVIN